MAHDPQILDHEYDGIKEFDNPTPGWWNFLFFFFILFGIVYIFMAFASPYVPTPAQELERAQLKWTKLKFATLGELQPTPETIASYSKSQEWMDYAKGLFKANCVACHGPDGGGVVGPNFCDDYGKNLKTIGDIPNVITNGAGNGAMPAWGQRFQTNDIVLLSAYVASLRGTTPMVPKPPEGELMAPWPDVPAPVEEAPEEAAPEGG